MAYIKAVCEDISEDLVRFIPDNQSKTIYSKIENLPIKVKVGNVYELTVNEKNEITFIEEKLEETAQRKQHIKNKRQQLIDRNQ